MSSATTHIGGVVHVEQLGVTITVSRVGGGKMITIVVSQTLPLQATTQVVTGLVCKVPFGVQIMQPFVFGALNVPKGLVVLQDVNVVVAFTTMSSATTQIGGVGHVEQSGVTITVSLVGIGGYNTIIVVSHITPLHATTQVVNVSVCVPFGVQTTQPFASIGDNVPCVVTNPHVL